MKITIESTPKIITFELEEAGVAIHARVWQGQTESGIPVQVYVTRIAPEIPPDDPRNAEFQSALEEQARPRPTVEAIPLRLII